MPLPDYIQQGLGWSPGPMGFVDDGSMVPPMPEPQPGPTLSDFGGLHPDVARQIGLAPPLPPPEVAVAPPQQLPSMTAAPPEGPPPPAEYQVPAAAFGGGRPPAQAPQPSAPQPQRPPDQPRGFDAQMADLQRREDTVTNQQVGAIGAGVQAQEGLHADQLAAYQKNKDVLEANNAERKQAQEERDKVYAKNTAQVEADIQRIDNYKTNPNKFMDEMGLGDSMRWGIAQILAGFGQALMRQNGPNPVTAMLQQRIHDANVAQRDERDQMVQRLGFDKEARTEAQSFSTHRLADIDHRDGLAGVQLAKALEMAAAKSADPIARANGMAEAAKVRAEANKQLTKAIDMKSQHDIQVQQVGIAQQNANISAANAAESARHNAATEDLTAQQRDIEAAKALKAGKTDEAKLIRERSMGGESRPVLDKDGKVIGSEVGLITKKNGDVWIPNGTEQTVSALQKKHNASTQLVQTLDAIRREGPEWLTNMGNSDKYQRLKQLMGDLRLQAIAAKDLGVPTGHDIELAEAFAGTNDPTRWRDSLAGIMSSRDSIVRDHNVELRTAGLDKDWNPPDAGALPKPEETAEDKQVKVAMGSRSDDPGSVLDSQTGKYAPKMAGMYHVDPDAPATVPRPSPTDVEVTKNFPKMGAGQRALIETWAGALKSNDPQLATRAASILAKLSTDADEPGVRDYAAKVLRDNVGSNIPSSPEATTGASGEGHSGAVGGNSMAAPDGVDPRVWNQMIAPQARASTSTAR